VCGPVVIFRGQHLPDLHQVPSPSFSTISSSCCACAWHSTPSTVPPPSVPTARRSSEQRTSSSKGSAPPTSTTPILIKRDLFHALLLLKLYCSFSTSLVGIVPYAGTGFSSGTTCTLRRSSQFQQTDAAHVRHPSWISVSAHSRAQRSTRS
jgi:hypothetical protein